MNDYAYRFIGDELFDRVSPALLERTRAQPVIATDLARLYVCREYLDAGFTTVAWLDADFLVFDAARFVLPSTDAAVGREVWVQHDKQGKLKAYKKVHNAFLMFRRGNALLDFYIDTATRLLEGNTGTMPPQFIGPKLLTALHNVARLPVLETAAMFSPLVCRDLLAGGGPALDIFDSQSLERAAAANLCVSSCERGELTAGEMTQLVQLLLGKTN